MHSVHLGNVLITVLGLQVDGGDLVLIQQGFRQSGVHKQVDVSPERSDASRNCTQRNINGKANRARVNSCVPEAVLKHLMLCSSENILLLTICKNQIAEDV